MNKEKEIEEMSSIIRPFVTVLCEEDTVAEALIDAGYGNVKQAVKEFAEKLIDFCDKKIKFLKRTADLAQNKGMISLFCDFLQRCDEYKAMKIEIKNIINEHDGSNE